MTDRAPQVAAYLVERPSDDAGPNALWHELRERWPGLTREEAARGAHIASELMAASIAEQEAEHAAVTRYAAERQAVSQGIAHFGETEFREIAEGAGISLDAVRAAMQALQRGDPLPPIDHQPEEDAP